jgi:hypothetical protein
MMPARILSTTGDSIDGQGQQCTEERQEEHEAEAGQGEARREEVSPRTRVHLPHRSALSHVFPRRP